MTVRFTRVFGLYTFFSVFLPGITFLLLLTPLFTILFASTTVFQLQVGKPSQILTIAGVLVFVPLGLFVGFGLHTLGAWFEIRTGEVKFLPNFFDGLGTLCVKDYCIGNIIRKFKIDIGKTHRILFYEMLNGCTDVTDPHLVAAFLEKADASFEYFSLDRMAPRSRVEQVINLDNKSAFNERAVSRTRMLSKMIESVCFWKLESRPVKRQPKHSENTITESQSNALYTLVRGMVHMDQSGRSRTFQAVSASCRSMVVASWLLMVAYTAYLALAFTASTDEICDGTIPSVVNASIFKLNMNVHVPFETLEGIFAAFVLTVIVGFLGVYIFSGVARTSKHNYLEYLIGDYLLLTEAVGDNEIPDLTARTDGEHRQPRIRKDRSPRRR